MPPPFAALGQRGLRPLSREQKMDFALFFYCPKRQNQFKTCVYLIVGLFLNCSNCALRFVGGKAAVKERSDWPSCL